MPFDRFGADGIVGHILCGWKETMAVEGDYLRPRRPQHKISVFLSYPKPCLKEQESFIDRLCTYLDTRGMAPRTLGVTDYDMDAPLKAVRRLMLESNGLITIALRRLFVEKGTENYGATLATAEGRSLDATWLTSPWAHIEPAMGYQMGLPILILREDGVRPDGMLEPGVAGVYMPSFDPRGDLEDYFASVEWSDLIWKWESRVRRVVDKKGDPPALY
jgi:hypothetical protein